MRGILASPGRDGCSRPRAQTTYLGAPADGWARAGRERRPKSRSSGRFSPRSTPGRETDRVRHGPQSSARGAILRLVLRRFDVLSRRPSPRSHADGSDVRRQSLKRRLRASTLPLPCPPATGSLRRPRFSRSPGALFRFRAPGPETERARSNARCAHSCVVRGFDLRRPLGRRFRRAERIYSPSGRVGRATRSCSQATSTPWLATRYRLRASLVAADARCSRAAGRST